MHDGPVHIYVDGAVRVLTDANVDPGLLDIGLCYTTTRFRAREPLWPARHAARLTRDARTQGLTPPAADTVMTAMRDLGRAEFGDGEGVVRLQLGIDHHGVAHLVGVPRALGDEPEAWRLGCAPTVHPGPGSRSGAKLLGLPFITESRAWLDRNDGDEALLFDRHGLLVEGTRSNIIVIDEMGHPITPALELGPVAGIGIEASFDVWPALERGRLTRADLTGAREIIAVNAVRGACPCISIDGAPIGSGTPGPLAHWLAEALERA